MAPKREEDSTSESVQDSSQDSINTEIASSAAGATSRDSYRLALGLSKPDEVFNFRLTGPLTASAKRKGISTSGWPPCNLSVLHQRHLDFSSGITGLIAFYD